MFIRVFIQSSSNTKRGANGDSSPKESEKVWFNPSTGVIIHEHQNGTRSAYHFSNIIGDGFQVHFFDPKYTIETKTIEALLGFREVSAVTEDKKCQPKGKQKS